MSTTNTADSSLTDVGERGARIDVSEVEPRPTRPVLWWAAAGGLWLTFTAYVLIRWVTGPNFTAIPSGPTVPPAYMRISLTALTIIGFPLAGLVLYHCLIKPWLRERRITSDGLLVLVFATMYFQDPFSDAGGYWFTYNSWLPNMGSWVHYLPFWQSVATPGRGIAEPVLTMLPGYIYFWFAGVWGSTWLFRRILARWPRAGAAWATVGVFVALVVFDAVFEGLFWMQTGFYTYQGAGGPSLFPGSTYRFPLVEALLTASVFTPFVLLRYYRDDRGYTLVERGIERVRAGTKTKTLLRFLALVAAGQLIMLVFYNLVAYNVGLRAHAYPEPAQQRSYILNRVCGEPTDQACPGSSIPRPDGNSAYVGINNQLIVPPGTTLPAPVPVLRGAH